MTSYRIEHDLIGPMQVPSDALYGVHTTRSLENFALTGRRMHSAWIQAMGEVKLACATCSERQGAWKDDAAKANAIKSACKELSQGLLNASIPIDPLQGGAGTSLNMNVNEVIANRTLQILGAKLADYSRVSPLNDINYQQSTNDVCPSALKIAIIRQISAFLPSLKALELAFRKRAKDLQTVVKLGRTQFQDAVLTTLGFEFKAYAEVLARDIGRIERVQETLGCVNLGGTAIGTCVSAKADYVTSVVDVLAEVTGLKLKQNDDLIDGTQNLDVYVEVSSALKTLCMSLLKIASDLRFMSSGPQAGIGEISLPAKQAGSSIMPGKVNPVITEALSQVCLLVLGHDTSITVAASQGNLELNAFLPLIGDCLLNDLDALGNACTMLRVHCIEGLQANPDKCQESLASSTALITAMVSRIGYDRACQLGIDALASGQSIREKLLAEGLVSDTDIESFTSYEAVLKTMADKARTH